MVQAEGQAAWTRLITACTTSSAVPEDSWQVSRREMICLGGGQPEDWPCLSPGGGAPSRRRAPRRKRSGGCATSMAPAPVISAKRSWQEEELENSLQERALTGPHS